ncbi:transposase, partial [Flavobacterium sp. TAB 87]|uniref:transposase n=1 Tax=Flavobacterium sp. TAB 87 TaxID=1729581 RepID=UPI000AC42DF7
MQHITGISRNQMTISSLESSISTDNPIRFIDAFVEHIDLKALGFEVQILKTEGRPSFETNIFLKLYLYGYLNGLRSSRKLGKECLRNIEMQWLLEGIVP